MANALPKETATKVKALVYEAADKERYSAMSRIESGQFMDRLVKRRDIGGEIEKFIDKPEVRTYIKDGILNAYSKAKARKSKPDKTEIAALLSERSGRIYSHFEKDREIQIFAANGGEVTCYYVVCFGTLLKWETVLRKLLLASHKIISRGNGPEVKRLAILTTQGRMVTAPDRSNVISALSIAETDVHIVT
jgi:hypothetical protein